MAPVKKEMKPLGRTFIAERRDEMGLTQEQLAEKINLSRSMLSKIETGVQPYTQRTLEAIADALKCRPADLLMPEYNFQKIRGEEQIRNLLHRIDGLSEENINILTAVAVSYLPASARHEQTQAHDQQSASTLRHEVLPSR
jgi:transcriptional regulator with XRE-family HTH domain